MPPANLAPEPRDAKELGMSISITAQQRKTWEVKHEYHMTRVVRAKDNHVSYYYVSLLKTPLVHKHMKIMVLKRQAFLRNGDSTNRPWKA